MKLGEHDFLAYIHTRDKLLSAKKYLMQSTVNPMRHGSHVFDEALGRLREMIRRAWGVPDDQSIEKFIEEKRSKKWIPCGYNPPLQCKFCAKKAMYGWMESKTEDFACNPCMSMYQFGEGMDKEYCEVFFNAGHDTCAWLEGHTGPHGNFADIYGGGGH